MKARDLMTPDPRVVTGDTPVSDAARLMRDLNVGLIPVVDDLALKEGRIEPLRVEEVLERVSAPAVPAV